MYECMCMQDGVLFFPCSVSHCLTSNLQKVVLRQNFICCQCIRTGVSTASQSNTSAVNYCHLTKVRALFTIQILSQSPTFHPYQKSFCYFSIAIASGISFNYLTQLIQPSPQCKLSTGQLSLHSKTHLQTKQVLYVRQHH